MCIVAAQYIYTTVRGRYTRSLNTQSQANPKKYEQIERHDGKNAKIKRIHLLHTVALLIHIVLLFRNSSSFITSIGLCLSVGLFVVVLKAFG